MSYRHRSARILHYFLSDLVRDYYTHDITTGQIIPDVEDDPQQVLCRITDLVEQASHCLQRIVYEAMKEQNLQEEP